MKFYRHPTHKILGCVMDSRYSVQQNFHVTLYAYTRKYYTYKFTHIVIFINVTYRLINVIKKKQKKINLTKKKVIVIKNLPGIIDDKKKKNNFKKKTQEKMKKKGLITFRL